jgi:ribosomal protein S18 acetylase RimI-like enzyme
MDGILIRAVEEDDLASIVELLQQLKEHVQTVTKPDLNQVRLLYAEMLRNPQQYKNMVACANGKVVGFISVVYYLSFLGRGGTALVNELVVSSEHKRSGIGTALVQAAVNISRRDAMEQIEAGTEKDNLSAVSFYGKLGFDIEYRLFGMNLSFGQIP